jgi:Family of unknown function (DUF695)
MAWDAYLTEMDGRPGLVLLDRQFAAAPPAGQLPRLAWFAVYCQRVPSSAFWDPEETDALDRLEAALLDEADARADGWGVYVRRLATRGVREYYLYVAEHVDLSGVVAALRRRHPTYRVESDACADATWSHYRRWLVEPASPIA